MEGFIFLNKYLVHFRTTTIFFNNLYLRPVSNKENDEINRTIERDIERHGVKKRETKDQTV